MENYNFKQRKKIILDLYSDTAVKKFDFGEIQLNLSGDVLTPHINTLYLINIVSKFISTNSDINSIADLGTGSGFIALSLAKKFPGLDVFATDVCDNALVLARLNAEENDLKNVTLVKNSSGIWLSEILDKYIDIIVCNPPFIGKKEQKSSELVSKFPELKYEPDNALFTGDALGYKPYLDIFENAVGTSIRYFFLQGNTETLPDLHVLLEKKFIRKYDFKLLYKATTPIALFASPSWQTQP